LEILLAFAAVWMKIPTMMKGALFAVAGFLGVCVSVSAQQTQRPEPLQLDSALDRPYLGLPPISLEGQDRFFFSTAFGSMRPEVSFLPPFSPWESQSYALPNGPSRTNSRDDVVYLRNPDRIQYGGEIGFLYGKSSGKYGREDFESYIIGTIGNDKFSITAGFLHQETTFTGPRWRR
jgi:hypothetical protein